MGDEDSISRDRNPSPPLRHEKWKRVRLRPNGEYTSDASRAVVEKIVSIICCAYVMCYLNVVVITILILSCMLCRMCWLRRSAETHLFQNNDMIY